MESGLLKAEFTEDHDGSPIFIKDARITVAGRTEFAKLQQKRLWWRIAVWVFASATTIGTRLILAYLTTKFGLK